MAVDTLLGDAPIKKYLREVAAKEKEEFSVITNRESTAGDRSTAIKKMAEPREFLAGFFHAIGLIHGSDKAKYYENYFYQARSDDGVSG